MEIDKSKLILRATTLWAFAECALGGVMHAVQSPFTGLIVASVSVAMIGVIVLVGKADFRTLSSALLAVLTVKFLLSPHSSPSAYLAVSFQAVVGFGILQWIRPMRLAMLLFGVIALVESAMQKIIVLYVLFGSSLDSALATWQTWISKKYDVYLSWLAFDSMAYMYVGVFAAVGGVAGWLAANLIERLQYTEVVPTYTLPPGLLNHERQKNSMSKRLVTMLAMAALLFFTYLLSDEDSMYLPWLRIALFVLLWVLVVLPLFRFVGQKYLFKSDVSHITDEFEELKSVFLYLWHQSKDRGALSRVTRVIGTFISTYLLLGVKSPNG